MWLHDYNKIMYSYCAIIQQDEVISELREYASSSLAPPEDVNATVSYLSALNSIFERTILGRKTRIFKPDGLGIQRLNQGFSYFEEWAEELVKAGRFECGVECKDFLSWQVGLINTCMHAAM